MAKQTTVKVKMKHFPIFKMLAPVEGVKMVSANQVGETAIVEVKYRDPAYLYYLAQNVLETYHAGGPHNEKQGQTAVPSQTVDNKNKKQDGKEKQRTVGGR